jgi:hypothetical protein
MLNLIVAGMTREEAGSAIPALMDHSSPMALGTSAQVWRFHVQSSRRRRPAETERTGPALAKAQQEFAGASSQPGARRRSPPDRRMFAGIGRG